MRELTRREALSGATGLGAVAIAGCVSNNDDPDAANSDPDSENGQDNGNDTDAANSDPDSESENGQDNGAESQDNSDDQGTELELTGTTVTASNGSCGSGDQVEASVADGDITLSGKLPTSNQCHEAVMREGTLEDGSLSVTVAAESTSGDDLCASCLGVVDYEGRLEFSQELTDLSGLTNITVEHGGRSGETHTIEQIGVMSGDVSGTEDGSGDDATETAVLADSIVTTERGCTSDVPPSGGPERAEADEEREFSQSNNTITIQGSVTAPTPCHEAYIDSVSYENGVLSVTVGAESNLDPDQVCVECLAELEYEAAVEVDDDITVDAVSVSHIQWS